ncbi:DUF433 domain-containing protein [Tsukamurella ocularis]|uniref:DUF433 domain-containing protein n=1 Tax=Tsukamurella ocularis TaxID=1970234 RepID=UPI00216A2B76|nr:DUF433 domain-containing protein [Tsukamurella ocularis]MCS3778485.1 uncharacterized protein (DUF433 family) [Tsukamurella ocularis]MCS3789186.1 uncharacterized protein (DUF433 family) [Tsukamurella ocularis]MCS3853036.1 uncharacterized protein (DUF433 family) [Tsukamurella ocularis]
MSYLGRVTANPEICHCQAVIRGMRYPVADLLDLLASGMSIKEIVSDYLKLEREDLLAALEFAAQATGHRYVVPFDAD